VHRPGTGAIGRAPVGGSNRLLSVDELAAFRACRRRRSTAAGGDTTASNRPPNCGNCHVVYDLRDFEGTLEIQRMIIGRAVAGLDVR
jgi:hypothetical protein